LFSIDVDGLKKLLSIRLFFEGPISWSVREYIEFIDDYLMERLPIILNDLLEPYGLEASILDQDDACRVVKDCSDATVIGVYSRESGSRVAYAVFRHRVGDNTLSFYLERVMEVG